MKDRHRLYSCLLKHRYASRRAAQRVAQKRNTKYALRVYRCDYGDHYHITSRAK